MELVQSHLESLCGSQLWDNTTVYSDNPDFTVCFQQTVLIWLPCTVLILISPLWIYMLTRQITSKLRFSWVFILKIVSINSLKKISLNKFKIILFNFLQKVLTAVLMAIEVCNIYKAYVYNQPRIFYISPMIQIKTYFTVINLTNFERRRGLNKSTLLFTFWLLSFFAACIRLRSQIIVFVKVITRKLYQYIFNINLQ